MIKIRSIILSIIALLVIVLLSCTASDLDDFQINDYIEYRMFGLLDDYPSLYEAVNSLDQTVVNAYLGDAVNFKTDEFIAMTQSTIDLLNYKTDPDGVGYHEANPVPETLKRARRVLERVIEQDQRDRDGSNTSYASELFGFLDTVRNAKLGYEDDILEIMFKEADYTLEREYAGAGYILKNSEETIANLVDPDTLMTARHAQQTLGKMLIQADSYMTVDGSGNLVPDGSGTDIGLGNSVRGIGALLKGVIDLLQDSGVRDSLYDVIRELGTVASAKISTSVTAYIDGTCATDGFKRMKDILREEIENKEDYFTEGGAVYSDPVNDIYRRRTATEYADSELRNVSKELLPHTISLILRGDRPGAMFADSGNKEYFAERFVANLKRLNVDWDNAHLEESLYDLIRFDPYGRDRTSSTPHPVIGHAAYDISMLEALISAGGVTTNMGWFDGGGTSEITDEPNASHGHGAPAGYLTLNDSVFAMKTRLDTGNSMYDTVLNDGNGWDNRTFRSKDPFTSADALAGKCQIKYDQNYSVLNFLATHSVGDVGSPTGGNPNGSTSGLNKYVPYSPTGRKDNNTATSNMNWVGRVCWNGEGPYYYADPAAETKDINGKTYYRYLRPNGKTYAYVHKADPSNSSTWDYIYPAEDGEPVDIIEYFARQNNTRCVMISNVDLSGGVTLYGAFSTAKIRIRLGTENQVASFSIGLVSTTYTRNDIINEINSVFGRTVASAEGSNYIRIVSNSGPITLINESNLTLTKNPVGIMLRDDCPAGQYEQVVMDVNAFNISGDGTVDMNIDGVTHSLNFPKVSPDGDGAWTGDEVASVIRAGFSSKNVTPYSGGVVVMTESDVQGTAQIGITNTSGINVVEEVFGGSGSSIQVNDIERYHRYRPSWRTDYYMIRVTRDSSELFFTPRDMVTGTATEASCFVIDEIIPEGEPKRACASPEEATYRNLQWLLTEKKMVLVLPMYLYVNVVACSGQIGFFQIVEGNGFEGLVNARVFRQNKYWAKKGTGGSSIIPGDYRLYVDASTGDEIILGIKLNQAKVLGTMGNSSSNPAMVPHNFASISRMAFPRSEVKNLTAGHTEYGNAYGNTVSFQDFSVGSREFEASSSDPVWKNRNGLVPLIVAALSAAWEMSDDNHMGILRILDSQFASLKPLFFYNRNTSGVLRESWLPRIAGSETNIYDFLLPDEDAPGFTSSTSDATGYFGGWSVRNHYQLKSMPTAMTFMVDSDPGDLSRRADGLLAAISAYNPSADRGTDNEPNTRIITKLIKFLDTISGPGFADPDPSSVDDGDLATYGVRRKLFYGVEQVMTMQRIVRDANPNDSTINLTMIDASNYKKLAYPSWLFTWKDADNNHVHDGMEGGDFDDIRPEDIVVDEGLDISIGSDALGTGLAVYPDERDPSHPGYVAGKSWYFFNDAADKAIEFTSNNGKGAGKFNVTENMISLMDTFLRKVTPTEAQINGLIHTIGIINAEYSVPMGKWIYPDDLAEIQTRYLPTMMDIQKGYQTDSTEFNYALMSGGSLIEYILDTMETPYSTTEIVGDMYRLLGNPLISENNSRFWSDLIEMNGGLIAAIQNRVTPLEFTESNDFQYNGPYSESIFDTWDPFGDLGKVFTP